MTKILLLAANPQDAHLSHLDNEIAAIQAELDRAKFGRQFKFEHRPAVKLKDLQGILEKSKPDIVHFSGHATYSSEIVLVDDNGLSRPVAYETIKKILFEFRGSIQCVVFNTCYGEELANAVAENIDCVIGMLGEVEDELAPDFARELYRQLGSGQDIATAFTRARTQLDKHSNIARLLTLRANPSQITFVTTHLRTYLFVLGWMLPAFLIYLLANGSTYALEYVEPGIRVRIAVALASSIGIVWGIFGVRYIVMPLLKKYFIRLNTLRAIKERILCHDLRSLSSLFVCPCDFGWIIGTWMYS